MNKKISFIFCLICIAAIISVSGCSSNKTKANSSNTNSDKTKNKLTLEQINQSYAKTDEKVLNTQEYKNYVLVESQAPTISNRFTLYNLKTGDKDTLPNGIDFIDSAKIIDENNIILYTKGTNSESSLQVFPYEIDCIRQVKNSSSDGDFIPIDKDIKFPIDKQISLKGTGKQVINDIRTTLNGIQISFIPQDANDPSIYAGYTDIPPLDISYDKTAGDFSLKFQDTKIIKALSETNSLLNSNIFINSFNLKEVDNSVILAIKLNETAKYFTGKKATIAYYAADGKLNVFPYLDIKFMSNIDNLY